jgi:hypothetical protein
MYISAMLRESKVYALQLGAVEYYSLRGSRNLHAQ